MNLLQEQLQIGDLVSVSCGTLNLPAIVVEFNKTFQPRFCWLYRQETAEETVNDLRLTTAKKIHMGKYTRVVKITELSFEPMYRGEVLKVQALIKQNQYKKHKKRRYGKV